MINKSVLLLFLLLIISCKTDQPELVSISDDIHFLANDTLGGRKTGSK